MRLFILHGGKKISEILTCTGPHREPPGDLRIEPSSVLCHPSTGKSTLWECSGKWPYFKELFGRDDQHSVILKPAGREGGGEWAWNGVKWASVFLSQVPQVSDLWAICIGTSYPSSLSEMCLDSLIGIFYLWCCHFLFSVFQKLQHQGRGLNNYY